MSEVPIKDDGKGRVEIRWPWDDLVVYGPNGQALVHLEVMDVGRHSTPWCQPPGPEDENAGGYAHLIAYPDVTAQVALEAPQAFSEAAEQPSSIADLMPSVPWCPESWQEGPWPIASVLATLADAADHLLRDHNCDRLGHERIAIAVERARQFLAEVQA